MNKENVQALINELDGKTIVAATKYIDAYKTAELFSYGITDCGENRIDPFLEKHELLKDLGVIWHFIGSLQTKKVRKVINKIDFLHSLDRLSLADEIEKRSEKVIKCFVQVNGSNEEQKHGIKLDDVKDFIKDMKDFKKIEIVGLMTMAMNTSDKNVIESTFDNVRMLRDEIKAINQKNAPCYALSMGMSNDYKIAALRGATHLRLGSILLKG